MTRAEFEKLLGNYRRYSAMESGARSYVERENHRKGGEEIRAAIIAAFDSLRAPAVDVEAIRKVDGEMQRLLNGDWAGSWARACMHDWSARLLAAIGEGK